MKLLFEIPEEIAEQLMLIDGSITNRTEICAELSTHIKVSFEDMLGSDDDTFLCNIQEENYTFGIESPEAILTAVKEWDAAIRGEAFEAIRAICGADADSLPMDDPQTDRMKKAALALDNAFHAFADRMVLIPSEYGSDYMKPQIPEDMAAAAVQNPNRFGLVEIWAM